ncbi:hypothetical protein Efla_003666 [Eimeria flavescens]
MEACHAALAPEAGALTSKGNLLNILVRDPAASAVIGLPIAPANEDAKETKAADSSLTQQSEVLSGFPRRYATVEEVDDAICKNRSRVSETWTLVDYRASYGLSQFLIALAVGILTELFLFSMTISPFHTGGVARALAQTLTNVNALWKLTIVVRSIYVATLFVVSSRAYFAKTAVSGDWRRVCKVALAGMILELVFTLLVKYVNSIFKDESELIMPRLLYRRLNIIAFVTRGLIASNHPIAAFYATTLASIVAATSGEYVAVAPAPASV